MLSNLSDRRVSPLRARMIEDMTVRGFTEKTRQDYVRHAQAFAAFIGRSPATATPDDIRGFQLHQRQSGMQPPSINTAVSALRFLFTVTLDRPELARRLTVVRQPRRLPSVLSVEEVALLLQAAPGPKYRAAFATAYGAGLRVSEVVALKVGDIDSERMLLRVEQGKGPALPAPHPAQGLPPDPPLRAARQRRLQRQHRACQGADRRARAVGGYTDRAQQPGSNGQCGDRPSPAMPLLRRADDHRRNLRAQPCAARPAGWSPRQDRDTMTTVVTPSHRSPAGGRRSRCRSPIAASPQNTRAVPPASPRSPSRKPRRLRSDRCSRSATVAFADQRIARRGRPAVKSP
jgi:integrase